MNSSRYFFFITLSIITLFSCKRPQLISSTGTDTTAPKASCEVQEIDFVYLTSKAKLRYKDSENEQKSNINFRIKKDSVIWISINAAAGFEAFRIMILQDSIHILDRLKNTYSVKDFQTLSRGLGIDLNYSMIQGLIVGNLMNPKSPMDEVIQSDTSYCAFTQTKPPILITNFIKPQISKLVKVLLADGVNSLTIQYLNFVPLGNYSFPSQNDITLNYKEQNKDQTVEVHIEHNKTELPDKEVNFPFNVPNKFEKK